MTSHDTRRIAPFRHLRIKACLRLPVAFRRDVYKRQAYDAQSGYVMTNQPVEALKKALLPDYFEVDFVRVYDEV